jgi:hypothetical protein
MRKTPYIVAAIVMLAFTTGCRQQRQGRVSTENNGLRIEFHVDNPRLKVGNPLRIKVAMTNLTSKHLAVPKQLTFSRDSKQPVSHSLVYVAPPPVIREDGTLEGIGGGRPGWRGYRPVHTWDVVRLKPGETKDYRLTIVPKLAGNARVWVRCVNTTETVLGLPQGIEVWKGKIELRGEVLKISSEDKEQKEESN